MKEIEYWRNLARNLLLDYEETIFNFHIEEGMAEAAADQEASEAVRESFNLSLDEYEYIHDKDWEAAYQAYLSKEENEYA